MIRKTACLVSSMLGALCLALSMFVTHTWRFDVDQATTLTHSLLLALIAVVLFLIATICGLWGHGERSCAKQSR